MRCREVDELSRKRGYTSFSPRAGIGNLIPHFAQTLLMDFFENCQNPNDAETIMLTEALGLQDVDDTEQWCKYSSSIVMMNLLTVISRGESRDV